MPVPVLMDISGSNIVAILVPFLFAAAAATLTYFVMKAIHKKKHPDEEDAAEAKRLRKEREKLKNKTMAKVTGKLQGNDTDDSDKESKPNGLRSGKHNKKKKK